MMRYLRRPAQLPKPLPDGSVPRRPAGATSLPESIVRARRGPFFEDSLPLVTQPTFALAISHTPWNVDRARNMDRMRPILNRSLLKGYREVTERMANCDWSRLMWGWGAVQPATHVVFLQDDLAVSPSFWEVVTAMVRAVPNRVLSLIANHPLSERALERREPWFVMCEVLGSGYCIPVPLLPVFLDWRDRLGERARTANEDYLISAFLFATGRKAWCPVPTVIQTQPDHVIASTNPLVAMTYLFRQSYLAWDDPAARHLPITDPAYWRPPPSPLDFGFNVTTPAPWRFDAHGLPIDERIDEQLVAMHHKIARAQGRVLKP